MQKVYSLSAVVALLALGGSARGDEPPVPRGGPGPVTTFGPDFGNFGRLNTQPANSPFGRGLGQIVNGWTRDGVHGQGLADRIQWLQQARRPDRNDLPSFRDRDDLWRRDGDNRWFRDRDIREDRREVRDDLNRLRDDERRVAGDREELRRDVDDLRRDRAGREGGRDFLDRDRDLREDQREVRDDVSRLRDDERRVAGDREQLGRDRDDLRRDRDRDDHRHDFVRGDRDDRGGRDRGDHGWHNGDDRGRRDRDDHGWRDRGDHRHDHDLVSHHPAARPGDFGRHVSPIAMNGEHGKAPPAGFHFGNEHGKLPSPPAVKVKGKGK